MGQTAHVELVPLWHGAIDPSPFGGGAKGELLGSRTQEPSPWPDAAARWALGEGWGLNARRKRLEVERRRLADPNCFSRYCACGCGARIPIPLEDAASSARFFVRGHSQKRPGRRGPTDA